MMRAIIRSRLFGRFLVWFLLVLPLMAAEKEEPGKKAVKQLEPAWQAKLNKFELMIFSVEEEPLSRVVLALNLQTERDLWDLDPEIGDNRSKPAPKMTFKFAVDDKVAHRKVSIYLHEMNGGALLRYIAMLSDTTVVAKGDHILFRDRKPNEKLPPARPGGDRYTAKWNSIIIPEKGTYESNLPLQTALYAVNTYGRQQAPSGIGPNFVVLSKQGLDKMITLNWPGQSVMSVIKQICLQGDFSIKAEHEAFLLIPNKKKPADAAEKDETE